MKFYVLLVFFSETEGNVIKQVHAGYPIRKIHAKRHIAREYTLMP